MVRVCSSIGGEFGLTRSHIALVVDGPLLVRCYTCTLPHSSRVVLTSCLCLSNVGCYAYACLLQRARFDHYDGGVGGLNKRNLNYFGRRLLLSDDTVLTVTYSSGQHYTFCPPAVWSPPCRCKYRLKARTRCGVEIWQSW